MNILTKWVNPDILRWARERLNLTIDEVVEESKKLAGQFYAAISPQQLAEWEEGKNQPDLEYLETFAEIYVCPVGYFFLDQTPMEEFPMSFRGISKDRRLVGSTSKRSLQRFIELAHWTVELLQKTEQSWPVRIRPGQLITRSTDVERYTVEYRRRFGWMTEQRQNLAGKPAEAFNWWRRIIEGEGVFCFELRLDPKEVRGAALWCEGYPFILVNHGDTEAAAGRIFTLLHEYAHLMSAKEGLVCDFRGIHQGYNPEPFANRFAARMLITPEELHERLDKLGEGRYRNDWPDSLLDKVRRPFFASRDVVAILLQELNFAPPNFYELKRQQWEDKKPWGRGGRRPPLNEQKLREIGYSLAGLLARAQMQDAFSWMDTSSQLGMKVEKAENFLHWAAAHAR
jgi:Zn-dependent peptidase ImmA (M78 family)